MQKRIISAAFAEEAIRRCAPPALHCRPEDISDIRPMEKGMTNRTFSFACKGERYVMRIPGEGTDQMIDRAAEAANYRAIAGRGLCDDPILLDPDTGYKITPFLRDVRVCDPAREEDLVRCMAFLRGFHAMELTVDHDFDIWKQMEFYETLWEGEPSFYPDYAATKAAVLSLRDFTERTAEKKCLTHIDAVPDNFLFHHDPAAEGGERLQLGDWEYSGMQDPHVDIAMFCIYSLYGREEIDHLIDLYFEGGCPRAVRVKIYCYIAACGLLWSNWCEYKRLLGVEFGAYAQAQYDYAREYYRVAARAMEELD